MTPSCRKITVFASLLEVAAYGLASPCATAVHTMDPSVAALQVCESEDSLVCSRSVMQ